MEKQESKKDSKFILILKQTRILLRSIPSPVVALFVVSVIVMNILANKTLVQTEYLAIDGGILFRSVGIIVIRRPDIDILVASVKRKLPCFISDRL